MCFTSLYGHQLPTIKPTIKPTTLPTTLPISIPIIITITDIIFDWSTYRIVIIIIPALLMARMPGFQLRWIWYLSVGAVLVQLALSLWLLRREFVRRLQFEPAVA